jgi:uncharacterized membrane protein SpoIIM required for sporulation
VTVLVELEAYVVAGFFGLMVPLYLFSRARGPSLWHRYRQALVLNLKGSLLVLAILAVAGFYEAVEVIAQM